MRTEIEEDRKIVHAFSRSRGEDSLIQLVLLVIVLSNKVIIYLFIYLSILNYGRFKLTGRSGQKPKVNIPSFSKHCNFSFEYKFKRA